MALLIPAAALARENNSRSLDIPNAVVVNHTTLKPGHYKVEWQQPGPKVQVEFVHNGKTVATAPATLKTNDSQVMQSDIMTHQNASHQAVLTEIDFGHQKEALIFPKRG
jgi:hypothetical protein